jgi:hypothetical protein
MRKLLLAASIAALGLAGTAATASAQVGSTCPSNPGPTAYAQPSPTDVQTPSADSGVGQLYVDPTDVLAPDSSPAVGGELGDQSLGYGEATPTTTVYTGTLSGVPGYGNLEGSTSGGVSGSAEGWTTGDTLGGGGDVNEGNTASVQGSVEGTCVSVTVP